MIHKNVIVKQSRSKKKGIITLMHILHHNSALVNPYEVFELVLVFLS